MKKELHFITGVLFVWNFLYIGVVFWSFLLQPDIIILFFFNIHFKHIKEIILYLRILFNGRYQIYGYKNKLLDIGLSMGYKTQKEFAEFLGIRRVQYNKYENNKEQPALEALYKISLKLNIKWRILFTQMNNILLFFIVIVQNNIFQFKIGSFYTKEVYSISKEGKKKEQKVPKVNVLLSKQVRT